MANNRKVFHIFISYGEKMYFPFSILLFYSFHKHSVCSCRLSLEYIKNSQIFTSHEPPQKWLCVICVNIFFLTFNLMFQYWKPFEIIKTDGMIINIKVLLYLSIVWYKSGLIGGMGTKRGWSLSVRWERQFKLCIHVEKLRLRGYAD